MRRFVFLVLVIALLGLVPLSASAVPPGAALRLDTSAAGRLTRTFTWDIAKTATPDTLEIAGGGSADSTFNVTVTKTGYSDEWSVGGEVCATNSGDAATDALAIMAAIEHRPGRGLWLPLTAGSVDVADHPIVASGETYCYPFDVVFTPVVGADYRTVVTATIANSQGERTGQMETRTLFTLPDTPDGFVNDQVTVDDSNGMSWTFTDTGTQTYDETFDTAGAFTNTATIAETGQSASATVTVTSRPGCSTDTDAVAYWCFDDQVSPTADGADGHDATLFGPAFETTDIAPMDGNVAALRLNGSSDYGWVPDPDGVENLDGFEEITIAAWINPDQLQHGGILVKYNSSQGGADGVSWGLDMNGDDLRLAYSWDEYPATDAALIPGRWQHVAGTWDGSDIRLYIDGVEVAHGIDVFTSIPDTDVPVNIGAAEGNVRGERIVFFDGLIDEVYLYDRALSQTEIRSLAGVVTPPPAPCETSSDAVAYWCFDDLTSPTGDGADGHDGTVVGAQFDTTDVPPVAGNVAALDFNGTTDYVEAADPGGVNNLDGFSGMTLAAWISPDTLSSPWGSRVIVSKYHSAQPFNTISYWLLQRGDEVEVFVSRQRVVDEDSLTSAGVDLAIDEWVHVAGTWDGSHLRLYVNGTQVAEKTTSVSEMDDSTIPVNIGSVEAFANGQRSALFDGLIDEVYIYDRALTLAEIRKLAGVVEPPPSGECETSSDAVAYWCFDDQTSPTEDGADGHDATVVGAQFDDTNIPSIPDNVAALRLDGVDDYTTTPDPGGENNLDGFTGLTLAAWVNPDGPQTSNGCCGSIVSKYERWLRGVSWGLDLAGNQLRFVYPNGEWTTAAAAVPSGSWSHVAGMWDGDSIHLYINGVLVGTGPSPYTVMGDTTTPVSVGSYTHFAGVGRAGFFDGLIDEVYIFDRALAPAEVAELAGLSATADWHADLVLVDVASGSFTHGLRWTPGLGFAPTPVTDTCASLAGGWTSAPQDFPYEVLDVTYTSGTLLRFDFEYPLRPVNAWLHNGATCDLPDSQGGGLPADVWWFQFDNALP